MTADERIAQLEVMIDELKARLDHVNRPTSMAKTLTCPACGCGEIFAVRKVNDATGDESMFPTKAALTVGGNEWVDGDPFHVYVCSACRLVEWYVQSTSKLLHDGDTVILHRRPVDGRTPTDTPYR